MSKTIIPTIKLSDDDCNILFQSITDKLKIENPKFFYPIYKKVIDDDTMSSEDLHCIMLDSKFKCKQILEKIIDSDDEDNFESDDEESGGDNDESRGDDEESVGDDKESVGDANLDSNEISESTSNIKTNELLVGGSSENDSDNESETVDDILNEKKDIDCIKTSNSVDDDNEDEYDDDAEIEEAINNTFTATAIIERTNKITGEKTCKEEKIHIKKSALLEPLKVMQDEYVIPSKIQNKNISDANDIYFIDVQVIADDRQGLLKDISEVFSREKINVVGVKTQTIKDLAYMTFTVEAIKSSGIHKILSMLLLINGVRIARRP